MNPQPAPRSPSRPGLGGRPHTARARGRLALAPLLVLGFAAGLALGLTSAGRGRAMPAGPAAPERVADGPAQASATAYPATRVFVPALNRRIGDVACASVLSVQSLGPKSSLAALVLWEASETGGPDCVAPTRRICSGLLRPGGSWDFSFDKDNLENATSGVIYSLAGGRMSEIGASVPDDPLVADYVCELLAGTLGNCSAYAQFAREFAAGGELDALRFDRAAGSPLAVQVHRRCPSYVSATVVTSAYAGVGAHALGTPSRDVGEHVYQAAPVIEDDLSIGNALYVQNAGAEPAAVSLWLQTELSCDGGRRCMTLDIDPGAIAIVPITACLRSGERGTARLTSGQPLAVVVDYVQPDNLASFTAVAAGPIHDTQGLPLPPESSFAASGALAFSPEHGWETEVTVQNQSATLAGEVAVNLVDAGGETLATRQGPLCAGGSRTFGFGDRADHPGMRAASIRVESLAGSGGAAERVPIAAVATLRRIPRQEGGWARETLAYNLAPGLAGPRSPGAGASVGPILALPVTWKDLDEAPHLTTEIAVTNHVSLPGWTDFAVLIYDQNDLVDVVCRRVGAGQTTYIDFQTSGLIPPGFRGSALVSATQWEHPVPVPGARPAGHRVGLGAAIVTRARTRIGEDIPGDEAGAVAGVPLAALPAAARIPSPCAAGAAPAAQQASEGHWQSLVPILSDHAGYNSRVTIANLGNSPTEVRLRFRAFGDCLRDRICHIAVLEPGGITTVGADACVGPDWYGSLVLHSREPLLVSAETVGASPVIRASGRPGRLPFDVNTDGRVDDGDRAAVDAALGSSPGAPGWNPLADLDGSGSIAPPDADLMRMNLCGAERPPGDVAAESPSLAGSAAWLPTLGYTMNVPACSALVSAQNLASEPAMPLLVTWDPPAAGFCAGPASLICGGILPPGGSWQFPTSAGGSQPRTGAVFSFNLRPLSTLGASVGGDTPAAEYLCRELPGLLVGDCDAFGHFNAAYAAGTDFAGVPMRRAAAGGLAVTVERACPGDRSPGVAASTAYAAPSTQSLGGADPMLGDYRMYAPFLLGNKAGHNTMIEVQNAGAAEARVELWIQAQDACSSSMSSLCETFDLGPGEGRSISVAGCSGPDWQGNAWLTSSEPLALTVDIFGQDMGSLYPGLAPFLGVDAAGDPLPEGGRTTAFGPLFFQPSSAWDSGVQVQNLSRNRPAQVRVEFLDADGAPITAYDDYICPAGSQTFFLPVVDAREEGIGSVRVVSQRLSTDAGLEPAPIAAMALLFRYSDPARSQYTAGATYTLRSEGEALLRWPGAAPEDPGGGSAGALTGIPVVALSGLAKRGGDQPESSEMAISNFVQAPGSTRVAVLLYDANGLVDVHCRHLDNGEVIHLALEALPGVPPSFRGAALVSATQWQHPVWGDGPPRNLVGIGAVAITRSAAGDPPGDEVAIAEGLPLVRAPAAIRADPQARCEPAIVLTPTPGPGGGRRVHLPWLTRNR